MSNIKAWRAKQRTSKPSSRQKRNGLFLDAFPICQRCGRRASEHAHHELPKGHPQRNNAQFMRALCEPCHVAIHQVVLVVTVNRSPSK